MTIIITWVNVWAPGPAPGGDHARLLAWELIVPSHDDVLSGARSLRGAGNRFDETERESAWRIRGAHLPLYSYDYDKNYPPVATAFRDAITAVDAVLFVTPEYNRSIPGALKNAIDWASRPCGMNALTRKPSAVIGTSPGKIGTAVAQQHLRSILAFCNSPLMNSIEAYSIRGWLDHRGRPRCKRVNQGVRPELHGRVPLL